MWDSAEDSVDGKRPSLKEHDFVPRSNATDSL